jgi:hypothetical protein
MNGTNNLKQVVSAYAQQWGKVFKINSTIDDIDALVKCLNDQYELVSKVIESIDQNQFQQWIERTIQNIVSLFHMKLLIFLFSYYRKFH